MNILILLLQMEKLMPSEAMAPWAPQLVSLALGLDLDLLTPSAGLFPPAQGPLVPSPHSSYGRRSGGLEAR